MSQVQLCSLSPINYKGIPCISTEMLAQAYEVEINSIQKNFSCNRERFTEGKHFFALAGDELRALKNCLTESKSVQIDKRARNFTLWTERGAARHAKMLNSDRAWDVFELLEETFFHVATKHSAEPFGNPEQLTSPLSRRTDPERKQLTAIINTWVGMAPIHYAAARAQVNAHFGVASVDALTVAQVKEAIQYVQGKIDALPAAPSTTPVTEDTRIPNAIAELRKLVTHCGMVRNIVSMECHPGGVSLNLSAQEREAYYALQGMYQTAVDNMYAATHALDACLKLRALYPIRR